MIGTEMPFCPRPRRFVPGQKGDTERLGQDVPVPLWFTLSLIKVFNATLQVYLPDLHSISCLNIIMGKYAILSQIKKFYDRI